MIFQRLDTDSSSAVFDSFVVAGKATPAEDLTNSYVAMRKAIVEKANAIEGKTYQFDLELALWFYEYMNGIQGFNAAVASNNDVWRFICCKVAPDIVESRYGLQEDHFYKKSFRAYFQSLWWYIHLSYQGAIEKTRLALRDLSTDYIMNLTERSGKDGLYLEVSREIMGQLALVPASTRNKKVNDKILFRRILIQNTAKGKSFNPVLEGKTKEYVSSLFAACGV